MYQLLAPESAKFIELVFVSSRDAQLECYNLLSGMSYSLEEERGDGED